LLDIKVRSAHWEINKVRSIPLLHADLDIAIEFPTVIILNCMLSL
jgi:hypothetical protein